MSLQYTPEFNKANYAWSFWCMLQQYNVYSRQKSKKKPTHYLQFLILTHLWPWNKFKIIKPGMHLKVLSKGIAMQSLKTSIKHAKFEDLH